MTLVTNAFSSFSQVGAREDLSNEITMISPTDTPFLGMIRKTKAANRYHEWQTDALAAAAANAQLEGDVIAAGASTATSRLYNTTQILYKACGVTGSASAADAAGRGREMIYQLLKRSKELKRDMEYACFNNQNPVHTTHPSNPGGGTASTTVAAVFRPVNAWITTNDIRGDGGSDGNADDPATDGTQRDLTEALLKQGFRIAWNQGGEPDVLICGPVNKQLISSFGGNATRYIQASDRLKAAITYYEHDFGTVTCYPDRFSRDRDVWVLDKSMWAWATYRPIKTEDLGRTGDADQAYVITEATLESKNQAASAVIADCTT